MKLLFIFILSAGCVFGESYFKFEDHDIYKHYKTHIDHQDFYQSYNPVKRIKNPVVNRTIDLTIYDLIDQIEIILKKKDTVLYESFMNQLGDVRFLNFSSALEKVKDYCRDQKASLCSKVDGVIVQEYDLKGIALPLKFKVKANLIVRNHLKAKYNQLIHEPESENIIRMISRTKNSRGHYNVVNVMSFKKHNRKFFKGHKKRYYTQYYQSYMEIDKENLAYYGNDAGKIKYKWKKKADIPLKIKLKKSKNKVLKNEALLFSKNFEKSNYKSELINHLLSDEETQKLIVIKKWEGLKLKFLPLSVIYKNIETLRDKIKSFMYQYLLSNGNDEFVYQLRKWIKRNREDVQNKLGVQFKKKMPSRDEVFNHLEKIYEVYPDTPWEKEYFVLKANGQRAYLGKTPIKRVLIGAKNIVKNMAKVENLASIGLATGMFMITGMPFISAAVHNITHDIIYPAKHGKDIKKYMLKNTPQNLLTSAIVTSGVIPGRLPHRLFLGGVKGSIQAMVSGRPVKLGVIAGGITEGLWSLLPPAARQWVVSGKNKNFINAVLELGENYTQAGLRGMIMNGMDDGDILKGLSEAAKFAAIETAFKIIMLGFRYQAQDYFNQEMVDDYGDFHNPIVADRAYDGKELLMNMNQFHDIQYRKDSLLRVIQRTYFGDDFASFHVLSHSSLSERTVMFDNVDTFIHEGFHYGQEMHLGMLNFFARYLKQGMKGYQIFEDYVCTCH